MVDYFNTGEINPDRFTQDIPGRAQTYLKENGERLMGYKNPPYFLRDNFTKDLALRDTVRVEGVKKPVEMLPEATKEYVPAKTIEEAEKSLGSKVIIEEGIKNKQALDVANAISKERNRILAKYPELSKVEIKNINISRIQGASGLYNESTRTLSIRPESTSKAARNMAAKYSELKVKSTTCLDAEGIYRHELGHAVQHQMISEETTFAIRNASFDYAESAVAKDISRYAVTNSDEAFAEMFSLMSSGQKTQFKTYQIAQKAIEGILK